MGRHIAQRHRHFTNETGTLLSNTLRSEALDAAAGRSGWIISDGRTGNEVQSRGVGDALGLDYVVIPVAPRGIWKVLAPWAPVNPTERFGTSGSPFHAPWPDFAVAIGRRTIPYIRKLKALAGQNTYTVILLDPKVSARTADLFWVPEHDSRRGPNVITTMTAPHSFSAHRIAELRKAIPPAIAALPQPRIAVSLGGPNSNYRYTTAAMGHLASALQSLSTLGAGLMITPSRRTPSGVTELLLKVLEGWPHTVWDGKGPNPYPHFIAHADALVAPADSVNMTGEACATGKPVYVFEPQGGSPKFSRFHDALRRHGAIRRLPTRFERLDTWTYLPINASETIAVEIASRWLERRQMVLSAQYATSSGADPGPDTRRG